jgi:hypothetical protein
VFLHNQTRRERQIPNDFDTGTRSGHGNTGMAPVTAKAAVALNQQMAMVKQHKTIRDAFNGVAKTLAACFRFLAGPIQRLVAATELVHGVIQRFCAFTHLFRKHYRMLKCGIRFRFLGRSRFHPDNQRIANFAQAFIFSFQQINTSNQRRAQVRLIVTKNRRQAGQ